MTQTDRILRHLKSGRGLTPLTALKRYGTFRLAARINELRRYGLDIHTHTIKRGGKHYASYRLAS